ncbi:hypothetical protein [Jannaschia pohangensis]|uniref:Roadblock/LAMTOR2 domain-containing protein n=1 Tax=Jannaschia pohangensis TaxID=390807 RepID=A0A1I3V0P4_9RHOB|nr:hypothetical protein [Jannaschia pohangensis]SFJ88998.1 hypothetical protein SAMN04488095_0061 [Jannaschia pohangensis]
MVAELLDGLTARHGACRVVAYADLSSRMVLVTNSAASTPREALNALCKEAAAALQDNPLTPPETCDVAITTAPDRVQVFLRLPTEDSEALCCICDPHLDLSAFVEEARDCLVRIAAPETDDDGDDA